MPHDGTVIFRSPNLLIREASCGEGGVAIVSFDCYSEQASLDRPGFGELFFRALGLTTFHVLSRRNRWYQHPELFEALAALRDRLTDYERVITYGSSMGGFAALTYGGRLGADVGLALSPQFSVDPKVAPFEQRWRADVAKIHFLRDGWSPPPLQYIAFDPSDMADARHAALFAARSPTVLIPARYGGHPVGAFLNEIGALRMIIERLAATAPLPLPVSEIVARMRSMRATSGQYLFTLAQRIPRHRSQAKLAIAHWASEAGNGNPVYLSHYAALLDAVGRYNEALPVHRLACSHPDPNPAAFWNLMAHHVALGQNADAERVAREGLVRYPQSLQLRRKLRWLIVRRRSQLDRLLPAFGRKLLQGTLDGVQAPQT